jgi:hypothetical protein
MLKDHLNLKGETIHEVCFPGKTAEEADKLYQENGEKVLSHFYQVLVGFLEKEQLQARAHACKTLEELEALKYNLTPDDFWEQLTTMIDAMEMTDIEKMFMFAKLSDRVMFSAKQWSNTIMHQRAQAIAKENPNKIVTKSSKIIMP